MKKNLLYTALGLMGIMGILSIGVVSAKDCPTGTTYYASVDGCSQTTPTLSSDELVYYRTDENNKDVISVKDPDSNTILTILDKNEGASIAGTLSQSYGYHYQRGNNTPFEMTCASNTSCSNASNFQTDTYANSPAIYQNFWPGHPYTNSTFIQGNSDYWSDNKHYDVLWGGLGDVGTTTSVDTFWGGIKNGDTRQGPCDTGYHVPSMGEWNALITYWYNTKHPSSKKSLTGLNSFSDGTFKTDFKLPLAGFRHYSSASLSLQGSYGYFWSSSPYSAGSDNARYLYLSSSSVNASNNRYRANGRSVRCFKDSYVAPSTYTLELDANGGTLLGADNEGKLIQKVSAGKKAQQPVAPTKDGANFQGWVYADDEATAFDFSTQTVNSNIQLKAKYVVIQYTVTFNYVTNGGTSATTGSVKVISGDTLDLSQYTGTKADREFIGWNTDSGATTGMANPTITAPITLYAIFKKNLIAIFTSNNANIAGNQTSGACTLYNIDTSCSITLPSITCDTGYHTPTRSPEILENITADTGATASCTVKEHKLNFVVDDKVIQSGDVAYGTDISSPANPNKECNSFAGWTSNVAGLTTTGTMPDSDVTFTANWNYTCSRSSGGGGRSRSSTANTQDSSTSSQNDEKTPDSSDKASEGQDNNTKDSSVESQNNNTNNSEQNTQNNSNTQQKTYSEEFQKAYTFSKEKSITTMDTIEDANMEKPLTRIAMAKMLSYYAINVLGKKSDTSRVNKFSDVSDKLDTQYDNGVTLAYQLGIMGINMSNNKFRPNDEVTRAEFATALSRMLYGTPDGNPYYATHLQKLKAEGILKNDDYKMKELRGYVMIMLMRSSK